MSNNFFLQACRVCGYQFDNFYPWGENGKVPSFSYCPCCFTEFGFDDLNIEIIKKRRSEWISGGYLWYEPQKKPINWEPEVQLKNISSEFI